MNRCSCTDISNNVNLPKDTRNHCNSNTEWWYYYAFLEGDNGESYATNAYIRYNPTRLSYGNSSLDFLDETNNYFNVNIIEDDNIIDLLFFPNKSI